MHMVSQFSQMACFGCCTGLTEIVEIWSNGAYSFRKQKRVEEGERELNLSIQPALAYVDMSMLESSAKVRMAAKQ